MLFMRMIFLWEAEKNSCFKQKRVEKFESENQAMCWWKKNFWIISLHIFSCMLERTDRSLKTAKTGENKTGLKNCEDGEMSSIFIV